MSGFDFDLFVVGAGSGGVRAARIAAAHGARVAIAEEHRVGGTCVIRGCVPKKLLVYGAHFAEDLDDAAMFGWDVPTKRFDWPVLRDNVLAEVSRIEGAYGETLANHNVTLFQTRAVLTGPNQLRLGDGRTVTAGKILLALGARPALPDDLPGVEHAITSNEVFDLEHMPRRIVIAGGGYIANEFAGIFNQFGAHVTIVNRSDTILRGYDEQIVDRLVKISLQKGIDFRFNAAFEAIERNDDGMLRCIMRGTDDIVADQILFAIGRLPNTDDLGLEELGVRRTDRGAVVVDDQYQTTVPSVFAVGDVTDRVQLTPVAIREGQAFADTQFGGRPCSVDYDNIPSAVFSHPPIGAVGLTEGQAKNKLGVIRTYTSDFRPMKNVLAGRNERSLYKMIVEEGSDRVVGIHMIGPDAPEILQAAAVAVKAGLTKVDFDATVALHPSMAEELVLMR